MLKPSTFCKGTGGDMLKRKALNSLIEWKNKAEKKCLIVQGARQVGKTYLIQDFAGSFYNETVEINFKETPSAKEIFSGDLNVDSIIMALRFRYPDKRIEPGDTLIFLDEIQECEEAITALKFLTIDGRFDVIASGSLLGVDYKRASSYPVGYVEYLKMNGLDFEEFLWAMNMRQDLIDSLHEFFDNCRPVPESVNAQMMTLFRTYMAVGGMPEVVNCLVENRDFRDADRVARDILQGYQYDIAHYASAEEKVKAEKCYLTLGRQLLDKENHKFQYKEIEKGARAQKYYSSIEWLIRADIVKLCPAVTDIKYDLNDYVKSETFRAYTTDLTLLTAMREFELKQHIIENTLAGNTKGGLYECAVADILHKSGYNTYFYKNESTRKVIDFIIQKNGEPIPIEVKSGNTRATSLNRIVWRTPGIHTAYKLVDGNVGENEMGIKTLPLYMVMFI